MRRSLRAVCVSALLFTAAPLPAPAAEAEAFLRAIGDHPEFRERKGGDAEA